MHKPLTCMRMSRIGLYLNQAKNIGSLDNQSGMTRDASLTHIWVRLRVSLTNDCLKFFARRPFNNNEGHESP